MKALILAAGFGIRLAPFTNHTPKPLFSLDSRPVLDITIERLQQAGCTAIIINTHHLHEQIQAFLTQRAYAVPVTTRHELNILGTGGALRNTADLWADAPLLVVNGDIVCDLDYAKLYKFHCCHDFPVTMTMHDHPCYNSVCMDDDKFIIGFKDKTPNKNQLVAFTGIHVIDPKVLDFLPSHGPAHIIDTYKQMLASGERIKAYTSQNFYWQDIGTPENYLSAAFDRMAPAAFAQAFPRQYSNSITRQKMHGDGSDRKWYRLKTNGHSMILAEHGIRNSKEQQEVDAYVHIGRHLWKKGVPVPRIHKHDTFSGLVFIEDLGDQHLQTAVQGQPLSQQRQIYENIIDILLHMGMEASRDFNTAWTYQTPQYNYAMIMENECRYFVDAFLSLYLEFKIQWDDLAGEFDQLAMHAANAKPTGFMHRDMQSRNILVKGHDIFFIDFQGGRLGPLQYDLASLLIDPYVDLPVALQDQLRDYYVQALHNQYGISSDQFQQSYPYCAVTRNLQILGAFGFLSRAKGKTAFETYIPIALRSLQRHLECMPSLKLPKLAAVCNQIACKLSNQPHK